MTRDEILVARELAVDTKAEELASLAIRAHANFADYNFEVYSNIAQQMAQEYGKNLFPEEDD